MTSPAWQHTSLRDRNTEREEVDTNRGNDKEKEAAGVDDDPKRPYKEVLESPFTRWIMEFSAPSHGMPTNLRVYDGSTDPDDHISRFVGDANQGEWEMPVWCRMFQQTLDGPARGWSDLREKFVERFALRRRCSKDPTEVSKIVRKANKSLPDFKERWTEEIGYIQGLPELKRQLEIALESEKLIHLVKDVRQRGENRGRQGGNGITHGKIINMNHDEVYSGRSIIPIQHYLGTNENERTPSYLVNHTCYDEVPNKQRNCNAGSMKGCNLQVQADRS
nr:reverse transcriptase domain-containing protein [Tanacetum cinerariifolium]